MEMEKITRYVYIAFVVIAIVMGLVVGYMAYDRGWYDKTVVDTDGWVTLILLILGIITGLISITEKEVTPFLIATVALLVAAANTTVWQSLSNIHDLLYDWAIAILRYIVAFAAPAAVITAIKSMLPIVKEK
jgi:DMSO reductase anchor subunit